MATIDQVSKINVATYQGRPLITGSINLFDFNKYSLYQIKTVVLRITCIDILCISTMGTTMGC